MKSQPIFSVMPLVASRTISKKERRLLQVLLATCFLYAVHVYSSRGSPTTYRTVLTNENPYLPQEKSPNKRPADQDEPSADPSVDGRLELPKYIHLDLKGAPPSADKFYESFFDALQKLQMGVQGLLMEYEDTLPLEGKLLNSTHLNGYTKADIALIQRSAKSHGMEIIPLIQTFGHFEWLLKLREFRSYRDNPVSPMVISPCLEESYVLIEDLLQQTLDLHPDSNIIHIGCDEVHLSNANPACTDISMSAAERYIRHVRRVANIAKKIRPGIRILIWDDILRGDKLINNDKLLNQLKGLVEPVSWNYNPKFDTRYKSSPAWSTYSKLFNARWAASAFKGGLHRFSMMTNTTHHVRNNHQWLHFMQASALPKKFFSAIILTGWSRFDHFMPLCDLLPSAYPALIYSLHALNTNQFLDSDSTMDCERLLRSVGKDTRACETMPGLGIWSSIASLPEFYAKMQHQLTYFRSVAPDYNRKNSFVRRQNLDSYVSQLQDLKRNLSTRRELVKRHLTELYSADVIHEWLELYMTPMDMQIKTTLSDFSAAREQEVWPRRPLLQSA